MALMRDRPYGNSNFLVTLGEEDSRSVTAGFAEVIFPRFTLDPGERQSVATASHADESAAAGASNRLILRRGLIGALDLYAWWNSVRKGDGAMRRAIKIDLLAEDRSTVVLTWHFFNVHPVTLSYSPLRATEGGIVMESVELAFERMEMS